MQFPIVASLPLLHDLFSIAVDWIMLTCWQTNTHTHWLNGLFPGEISPFVFFLQLFKKEPLWINGPCFLQAGCPNCQHQGTERNSKVLTPTSKNHLLLPHPSWWQRASNSLYADCICYFVKDFLQFIVQYVVTTKESCFWCWQNCVTKGKISYSRLCVRKTWGIDSCQSGNLSCYYLHCPKNLSTFLFFE